MTDEQITEGARSQGGKERMRFGALVETLALPNWKRVDIVKGPAKDLLAEGNSDGLPACSFLVKARSPKVLLLVIVLAAAAAPST